MRATTCPDPAWTGPACTSSTRSADRNGAFIGPPCGSAGRPLQAPDLRTRDLVVGLPEAGSLDVSPRLAFEDCVDGPMAHAEAQRDFRHRHPLLAQPAD